MPCRTRLLLSTSSSFRHSRKSMRLEGNSEVYHGRSLTRHFQSCRMMPRKMHSRNTKRRLWVSTSKKKLASRRLFGVSWHSRLPRSSAPTTKSTSLGILTIVGDATLFLRHLVRKGMTFRNPFCCSRIHHP